MTCKRIYDTLTELGWIFIDGAPYDESSLSNPNSFFIHKNKTKIEDFYIGLSVIFSKRNENKVTLNKCLILNPIDNCSIMALPKYMSKSVEIGSSFKKSLNSEIELLMSDKTDVEEYIKLLKNKSLNLSEVESLGKKLLKARFFNNQLYHKIDLEQSTGSQVFLGRKLSNKNNNRNLYELLINATDNLLNINHPLPLDFIIKNNDESSNMRTETPLKSPSRRQYLINNIEGLSNHFLVELGDSPIGFREFNF